MTISIKPWLIASSLFSAAIVLASAGAAPTPETPQAENKRAVVYQVFTRLFGNKVDRNIPWGSIEQNGVGKFADFTDDALQGIKELGVTHIWYTGVPHHAVIRDYQAYGISNDDPDVVKGRAGSPYAVKDYYNVNPDLAVDPAKRLQEFDALIQRTHDAGMKVIIDIVPNHVARRYQSLNNPHGVEDFGASDDTSVAYKRDNNFYYVTGQDFKVPEWLDGYRPLNGEAHPLIDAEFLESPAKWTGNGSREPQPHFHDWYETVKINYGVRPDGSYDFPALPKDYANRSIAEHAAFWHDKDLPDSWYKFRDIVFFWLDRGVDGFRYDMAEMVPVEFWSFLNSAIKMRNADAFILAEVYNPNEYRNYLHLGRMDYLYDKVETYDTLKAIIQGKQSTDALAPIQDGLADIAEHMLHFLENHDEQRIASPDFAGDARNALPAMVYSATVSSAPTMLYFAQDVGEPASQDAGFGKATRTSIFDYWGVPSHQRWMNGGKFDGGKLTDSERALREYYIRLMNISRDAPALQGEYMSLHAHNRQFTDGYNQQTYAFARWSPNQKLMVLNNFDAQQGQQFGLRIPSSLINTWRLKDGAYQMQDLLSDRQIELRVNNQQGIATIELAPLASMILQF